VLSALRTKFLATDMTARMTPPAAAGPDAAGPGMRQVANSAGWAPAFAPPRPAGAPAVAEGLPLWEADADREQPGGPAPWPANASSAASAARSPATPAAVGERAVQMHDRYIVVESRDGIEVIDQHALHERLLYERLKASVAAGGLEVQSLLVPERVDLGPGEVAMLTEHAPTLARAGMRVEPFGGSTVIVTSKPALSGRTAAAGGMLVDEVLHGIACKAAIKAGDPLSQAEVDALVRDRRIVPDSHHCPHGRPTSLTFSRQELDRQFRRT
jgi:DNA mismatch repair protein MutL